MTAHQPVTRGGKPWVPHYIEAIDDESCIGCGRCYKVCSHDVLLLIGIDEDGGQLDADDDEAERKVMSIQHPENCIGCQACAYVCGKKAQSYSTEMLA